MSTKRAPSRGRSASARLLRGRHVTITLGDFRLTGAQDCANTFDADEFDPEQYDNADDAVAAFVAEMDPEEWIGAQDDLGGHTGKTAFRAWLEGYSECARRRLNNAMIARRASRMRNLEQFFLATSSREEPDPVIIESFDTLPQALEALARLPAGEILYGDADGPDFTLVFTGTGSELLYWEFDDLNVKPSDAGDMLRVVKAQVDQVRTVSGASYIFTKEQAFDYLNRVYADARAELRRTGYRWNPCHRRSR